MSDLDKLIEQDRQASIHESFLCHDIVFVMSAKGEVETLRTALAAATRERDEAREAARAWHDRHDEVWRTAGELRKGEAEALAVLGECRGNINHEDACPQTAPASRYGPCACILFRIDALTAKGEGR